MAQQNNRKADFFDHVILIFSIVLLLLVIFTFVMKWWLGT